jgi:hypothetical protein
MSYGQMSFWTNLVGANIFLGNCLLVKCLSGQMSLWANDIWANVTIGQMSPLLNVVWTNVYEQMSMGRRRMVKRHRTKLMICH